MNSRVPAVFLAVLSIAARIPAAGAAVQGIDDPGTADYALIDSCNYPDNSAARSAWNAVAGSPAVSTADAGARKVLRVS